MLFNSFIFFIFLGAILPIFFLLPSKSTKNSFLLAASYVFYGYWDWRFCMLLAASTIIDYLVGQALHASQDERIRKRWMLTSLVVNLGFLGVFKYFNFFADSFRDLSANLGWELDFLHLNILLPVGISFYTFQTLSYTLDIYRRKLEPCRNFIDFALFVSFFPQLVAGPIERAKTLLPQLGKKLSPTKAQLKQGIVLIIMGLFRKVMIGDTAGKYVDHIFGDMQEYKAAELLFALLLFSIQIYADFSGYSHIARGTAKLLGVELMKNFEQPYLSRNITEFWRRWHISLSSWLRDYLYISLGGNRKGQNRTYINLMLTMLLGGLWHGASWNFVIWGGLHGAYLAIHKLILGNQRIDSSPMTSFGIKQAFQVLITFVLVLFTWLFFRSTSWESTELFFSKIWNWEVSELTVRLIPIGATYLLATLLLDVFEYRSGKHTYLLAVKSPGIRFGVLFAMLISTFIYMFQADPLPFIYFQF